MIGPLMNKLRAFLLRRFARAAIAAGPSTFDMADVLDHGGLCLARLPKGILGEETAQLVGSFIVARTWQAAARRARLPEHARPDAGLYIDECQNFLNLPYPLEDMLAEARAYRLSVVMAHQNLAQLPPDLRQGISANARSQVIFSVSPEDARDLERHTAPVLTAHDLSHLGAYQAAARLVAGSAEQPAFTLRTRPLPPPVPGRARLIRRAARAAHSGTAGPAPRPAAGGADPGSARPPDPGPPPRRIMLTSPALPGQPRTGGRLARGPQLAAALAARLTARDRWILRMLLEHRVLTTGQLTDLAFGTTRACTARMGVLYQLRAVDRFRPLAVAGSAPLHFVLDEAGAAVLAAEDGTTAAGLGWRRDRAMAIALSPRLAHDTGASGVFTALAAAARASGGRQALELWWSERRCAATWDRARPDGYGRWRDQPPGRPGRRRRLLPRVRHRHRAPGPAHRQARRVPGPRRPDRHPHPRPVLGAGHAARGRAARPAGRPAPARHPRGRLGRAGPRRPHRHRRRRHQPRRARRSRLAARRRPRAAAAARPARPARRSRPARRARRPARSPAGGLPWHPPGPVPPAWHALPGSYQAARR